MFDQLSTFLKTLHDLNVVVFPYFLCIIGIITVICVRKADFVNRNGLQIIAIIVLVPAILVAWERKWISSDAGAAIISGIGAYAFGSSKKDD